MVINEQRMTLIEREVKIDMMFQAFLAESNSG